MLVTQPDKPAGRSLVLKKNPVKVLSESLGIKIFQPEKLDENAYKILASLNADLFLTFAYGKILPEIFLKLPRLFSINIHASLLPKYRGSSPIQSAILNSEKKTGICIMKMVKEMDAGPIFKSKDLLITDKMNAGDLFEEVAKLAAEFVPDSLTELNKDSIFIEQDLSRASFTKKITKDDGYIDFRKTSSEIYSIFKAFTPWPGIWTTFNNMRLKLIDISISKEIIEPGVVKYEKAKIRIGTLDGSIEVNMLQLESKKIVSSKDFIAGQSKFEGSKLPS